MTRKFSFWHFVIGAINSLHNGSRPSGGKPDHNEKAGGKTAGTLSPSDFLYDVIDDLK